MSDDLNKYQLMAEDAKAESGQLTHALYIAHKESTKLKATLKELVEFLEYEEAYTVDTRSQIRIGEKLKKIEVWPKSQSKS